MNVTMQNLVNRIKLDTELLVQNPEQKELLTKRIERHKELIVECALNNSNNPMLDKIIL